MEKKPKKPVNKDAWMGTYSDMVTLLLCFFVLLFASSSVDSSKWAILVQALNPDAGQEVSQIVMEGVDDEGSDPFDSTGKGLLTDVAEFQDLYYAMEEYVEQNGMQDQVQVMSGEGYTFLVFRNDIFFDGDSSILKERGKEVLNFLAGGIQHISEDVKEMRILGHTNQADPSTPNPIAGDRYLSSDRSTAVLVYIQEKNILDPKKLQSIGCGQFYPIASFTRDDDRARNRRVEILITETGHVSYTLDEIYADIDKQQNITVPEGGGEAAPDLTQKTKN